jgi:hypothetical protein
MEEPPSRDIFPQHPFTDATLLAITLASIITSILAPVISQVLVIYCCRAHLHSFPPHAHDFFRRKLLSRSTICGSPASIQEEALSRSHQGLREHVAARSLTCACLTWTGTLIHDYPIYLRLPSSTTPCHQDEEVSWPSRPPVPLRLC